MRNPFTKAPDLSLPEQFPISTEHLTVTIEETTVALDDVSVTIEPGEFVGIIGPNGSGKTTFENAILGLGGGVLKVSGAVKYGELDIYGKGMTEKHRAQLRAKHFGYVPKAAELSPDLTVVQNIMRPHYLLGNTVTLGMIHETADRFNLTSKLNTPVRALSSGFKQRVNVARGLVHDPNIAVLDEPTEALDPEQKVVLIQQLKAFTQDRNKTVIVVSHEDTGADRLITLSGGALIANSEVSGDAVA